MGMVATLEKPWWGTIVRQGCQAMRRVFGPALLAETIGLLVSTLAYANHDAIPDPPPHSTANTLVAIPDISRTGVTVSGLSSGGFFAHQFHIAFSKLVHGAGIIAGGPFGCVESIPNPYFPFMYVPLDRVSAATVPARTTMETDFMACRPPHPKPVLPSVSSGRLTPRTASTTPRISRNIGSGSFMAGTTASFRQKQLKP
jgi:hypothetical protein